MSNFSGAFGTDLNSLPNFATGFFEEKQFGAPGIFQSVLNQQFSPTSIGGQQFGGQFENFWQQFLAQITETLIGGGQQQPFAEFASGIDFKNIFSQFSPRQRGENPAAFNVMPQKLR